MSDIIVDLKCRDDDLLTVSTLFAKAYQARRVVEQDVSDKSRYSEILSDYFSLKRPTPLRFVSGLRL